VHATIVENLITCLTRHVHGDPTLRARRPLRVLEIGSPDMQLTYREVLASLNPVYLRASRHADGCTTLPHTDAEFDLVVCAEGLERCAKFWDLVAEMVRVCRPDGVTVLMAPSAGGPDPKAPDCYRFLPDGFRALALHADAILVDSWSDPRGPYQVQVAVLRKTQALPRSGGPVPCDRNADGDLQKEVGVSPHAEKEVSAGQEHLYSFLAKVHGAVAPRFYFEIGVFHGVSLGLAHCPAVGVDPDPDIRHLLPDQHRLEVTSSDSFFQSAEKVKSLGPLDLVLIDGMHLVENVLKDFMNVERASHTHTVIVIDDVFPAHPEQAQRRRVTESWTGDVWKFKAILSQLRPDLMLIPVDTSPTGCLVILGADATNATLWKHYDTTLAAFGQWGTAPTADILTREGAYDPADPLIFKMLKRMRHERELDLSQAGMANLRSLFHGSHPRQLVPFV
jgi:SAM-dependent methyltransferase